MQLSRICWNEEEREMHCGGPCYVSYWRVLGMEHLCLHTLLSGGLSPAWLGQQNGLSHLFMTLPSSPSALHPWNLLLWSSRLSPPAQCLRCTLFKWAVRMGTRSALLLPKPQQMASFRLSSQLGSEALHGWAGDFHFSSIKGHWNSSAAVVLCAAGRASGDAIDSSAGSTAAGVPGISVSLLKGMGRREGPRLKVGLRWL